MSKGQALPISTIVLIIIFMLAAAGLAIFYFGSMQKEKRSLSKSECTRTCQQVKSDVSSEQATDPSRVIELSESNKFCYHCMEHSCKIESANCTIRCKENRGWMNWTVCE